MEEIKKAKLDFFSTGFWIYLAVVEKGQGLIDIQAMIASLRLWTAQKLLYGCGPSWMNTSRLLLRRTGYLGNDKQLFLWRVGKVDFL